MSCIFQKNPMLMHTSTMCEMCMLECAVMEMCRVPDTIIP